MVFIDYHRLSMIEIGGFGDDHHLQFNGDGQPNTTHLWHKPVVTGTLHSQFETVVMYFFTLKIFMH